MILKYTIRKKWKSTCQTDEDYNNMQKGKDMTNKTNTPTREWRTSRGLRYLQGRLIIRPQPVNNYKGHLKQSTAIQNKKANKLDRIQGRTTKKDSNRRRETKDTEYYKQQSKHYRGNIYTHRVNTITINRKINTGDIPIAVKEKIRLRSRRIKDTKLTRIINIT